LGHAAWDMGHGMSFRAQASMQLGPVWMSWTIPIQLVAPQAHYVPNISEKETRRRQ